MDDETILAQANDTIQAQRLVIQRTAGSSPAMRARDAIAARAREVENLHPPKLTPEEEAEHKRRMKAQFERDRQDELRRRFSGLISQVGRRYRDCTIDNYHADTEAQQEALGLVVDYCGTVDEQLKAGRGALLYGPPGTGKDHLAVAIMRAAVLDAGAKVEWTDGAEFYGAVRDNIEGVRTESDFLKRFTKPDLLVISDPLPPVGAVNSGFQLSMLFRVIDRRYRDEMATVMTLNVANRKEAEDRLSPNIVDRLAHGAMAIHCNWKSYRRP